MHFMNSTQPTPSEHKSFNYRITEFFLSHTRLTIMCLLLLFVFGTVSFFVLKTSGFPNPNLDFIIVRTMYIGASSEAVARDVTTPLEGAIKNVDGIDTYSSTSSNNVSMISISLKDKVSVEKVKSDLESAIGSVGLPSAAEKPKFVTPSIGGFDFLFSISGRTLAETYALKQRVVNDLSQLPQTASVKPFIDLIQQVKVSLDLEPMKKKGVSVSEVQSQLASIGEQMPVVSDVNIEGKSRAIVTSITGSTLDDIRNFKIGGRKIPLRDFARVEMYYAFENNQKPKIALSNAGKSMVLGAISMQVHVVDGSDIVKYTEDLEKILRSYNDATYIDTYTLPEKKEKAWIIKDFAANDRNQVQVKEVVSGLVGSKLDIDGSWGNVGWLLGGVQLVFLVMLAFVSWRAAVVAALAIPLSLVFSNIYLMIIGESLNTLVLFSLVLVIGLVVDPALVILESIQRKIDIGLKGNEAALAAIRDTGTGLFLATLTSAIVFVPFAVVSGIMGQIFAYIPLTIIPATVGSYIVPLIFLAWIGGMFLRPAKNKTGDEWENLWSSARWIARVNYRILTGSKTVRILIIIIALIVPIGVTGAMFMSGKIKPAQFATAKNSEYGSLSATFLPQVTKERRDILTLKVLHIVAENPAVKIVFPQTSGFTYFILFKGIKDRQTYTSEMAVADMNQRFAKELGDGFYDIKASAISNGPPTGDYQVSIAIKTNNLSQLEFGAKDIGQTLLHACLRDGTTVVIDAKCSSENALTAKIDDGFTNRENAVYKIVIDREKLATKHLIIPGAPLTLLVNKGLKDLFSVQDGKKVGSIEVNGEQTEIVFDKLSADPMTRNDLENAVIASFGPYKIKTKDVATIIEERPKSDIQHVRGETVVVVKARLIEGHTDQGTAAKVTSAVVDYYKNKTASVDLLKGVKIESYSEGGTASFTKSFTELLVALLLAIVLTYVVLAIFFDSMTMPLVILFSIPLSFIGIFPALAVFSTGEFGFLEIIGMIILVGIIENVAIFLIDAARQYISGYDWDEKKSISFASGIRFRAVILTKLTAIASLAPLAFLSQQYRSMAIVIIFGLLTSGISSLFTTPILFIFFRWLSKAFRGMRWWNQILFFPLFPLYIVVLAARKSE